jgi:hypothetical protein
LSAEANNYGHKMQTLKDVFESGVYGSKWGRKIKLLSVLAWR